MSIFKKKYGESVDKPSVRICVNKIENKVTFKIKNGYSLELLTSETTKLLGSTKNKITKDKNGEIVPHLEIAKVVLVHCKLSIMIINKIQEFYIHLFQINLLVAFWKFLQQIISF